MFILVPVVAGQAFLAPDGDVFLSLCTGCGLGLRGAPADLHIVARWAQAHRLTSLGVITEPGVDQTMGHIFVVVFHSTSRFLYNLSLAGRLYFLE